VTGFGGSAVSTGAPLIDVNIGDASIGSVAPATKQITAPTAHSPGRRFRPGPPWLGEVPPAVRGGGGGNRRSAALPKRAYAVALPGCTCRPEPSG
jgi:hypothetical protein